MEIRAFALTILLACSTTAVAAPASDESIKQLLAVSQAQKLMDSMWTQLNSVIGNSIQQSLSGKAPTARQQKAVDALKAKMLALMQAELSWDKLEPVYMRLYKDSFTEEEVAGMVSFYKTPAGQAVINKMPVLMQKTMVEMQSMMSSLTPQMQKIMEEFATEMKSSSD